MDRSLLKQRAKQRVRRAIGEPHVGKRLKLRRVGERLDHLNLRPQRILDAGAEDATFVYWLADRYPEATITGVDIDADAVSACLAARPKAYASRVDFRRIDGFGDLPSEHFDLVTAFDVLEHIKDDEEAARGLHSVTRTGGRLLVHVPRDQWTHLDGRIEVVPDDEAWKINPGHVRHGYSPERLRQLLTGAGFTIDEEDLWLRRYSVCAFRAYERLEHPAALRLLSIPVTEVCGHLDRRRPRSEGNSVWMATTK